MERQHLGLQGRLSRFSRDIKHRFPGTTYHHETIQNQVLNPITGGQNPEKYLELVKMILRKAPELVKEFEDIASKFGTGEVEHQHQGNQYQTPDINLSRSSAWSATPTSYHGNAFSTKTANTNNIPSVLPPSLANQSAPQEWSSNETGPSNSTQGFQDDGRRDDVQNLLVLSEVNIPRHLRQRTPRQMFCALTEHQKIGLTWLLEQERDPKKRGGLLADTMGLGKTVQAMALMLAHQSKNPKQKTTLIVAPLALLRQWEQEILTKIKPNHQLKTLVFHGSVARELTISEVLKYDVVLCTYAKLQHEFKNKHEHKQPAKVKLLSNKANFHRVILDEAHNIRNQNTYCSKAAAEIKSTYRLCMTGTPFMNRAEEIFALIRFLKIPPYSNWERFSEDIVRPLRKWDGDGKDQAMMKLQALFRSFTLRRTKDSRLDGKPIIKLPPRVDQPAYVAFKDEQRKFYQALEVRQQLQFNRYLRNGAVMKNYMHILILLLRLRQACDHPFLLKNVGIPEGAKLDDKQMIKLACKIPAEVLQTIKKQKGFECLLCSEATNNPVIIVPCGHHICSNCFTGSVAVAETEGSSEALDDDGEDGADITRKKPRVPCPGDKCEHSITPTNIVCYNFLSDIPDSAPDSDSDDAQDDRFQYDTKDEEDVDDTKDEEDVGDTRDEEDADEKGNLRGFVVESGDEDDLGDADFLFEDIDDLFEDDDEDHRADGDGEMADDDGAGPFQVDGAFDDLRINNEMRNPKRKSSSTPLGGSSGKKKSRKSTGYSSTDKKRRYHKTKRVKTMADERQAAQRSSIAMSLYKARLRKEWISSAKIDAIMEILDEIRPTGAKTLVFSLWTSFLDLVEVPIEKAGIKYTRYDGSMTPGARDAAVKAFMQDQTVEVMLVSLTAGNAGLNLTAASQVIVTEPFWNPFVEEQAIDRAHRFGQKKQVTVHRLLIRGTVEDRIVSLQESKKMLVNAALSEKGAANVSRLNVAELRNLFGL